MSVLAALAVEAAAARSTAATRSSSTGSGHFLRRAMVATFFLSFFLSFFSLATRESERGVNSFFSVSFYFLVFDLQREKKTTS